MAWNTPESEIEAVSPRVLRRNWRFSSVPKLILYLLLTILAWEIVRQNKCNILPNSCRLGWLWSITIFGVGPTATLCGVFATLVLTREQFARLMRPNLTWTSHREKSGIFDYDAWTVRLMNAGPGIVQIESLKYSLSVLVGSKVHHRKDVTHHEAVALLAEAGLRQHVDYHLELITSGVSLPVVKQRSEATEFAVFTDGALISIRNLIFTIVTIDTMGDSHIGSLPFRATLPDDVRKARPTVLPRVD